MTAPWNEEEDKQLSQVLKKAKRKSTVRSILISLAVVLVTLTAIFFGAAQMVNHRSSETLTSEWMYRMISSPNEYESGYKDTRGFLSGVLETNTYKIIEGVPIPWDQEWTNYNEWWFPFTTGAYGGTSALTVSNSELEQAGYEYGRQYNPYNGQREMLYYIPEVDYNGKIFNDLSLLSEMEPGKLAEMSLSFDQSYSFEEVRAMLPAGVRPVWYWVDTYGERKGFQFEPREDGNGGTSYPLPMSGYGVYGFGIRPDYDKVTPEDFVDSVQSGLSRKDIYYEEYKQIIENLKKDKTAPEASDVRILGVVVTGTAPGLASLQGQSYIRGAVLGAVVDKY
ncbi:anti-sigma factor [Paenibacillus sp. DMB5]|uniref:anti-sigma factor n=1 Tax=Paenibacillus sp. DMB5 TaxID=1780103 RepID=UPI00076C65B2|nr:anti-sigma factor [Paenibacillus sp. DMB5]KUP24302.1 hypothetical protein AWJ19_13910 [Paenibacillus sp. DMB5]